jgi:hypothetical protein
MRYLENFNNFEQSEIVINEISGYELIDIILNEVYDPNKKKPNYEERRESSQIICPCKENIYKGLKYKNCCLKKDDPYLNARIKNEFYNLGYCASIKGKKFQLNTTTHFLERLHRKSDELYKDNPNIVNPERDEALNLIFNNFDRVLNFLSTRKNDNVSLELVDMKAKDSKGNIMPYSVIIGITKIHGVYKMSLITHIKGERSYTKNYSTEASIIEKKSFDIYLKKLEKIYNYSNRELTETLCNLIGLDLETVIGYK